MKDYKDTLRDVIKYAKIDCDDLIGTLFLMGFTPYQLINDFDFDEEAVTSHSDFRKYADLYGEFQEVDKNIGKSAEKYDNKRYKVVKRELDANGNETYREYGDGYWQKWEYDDYGNIIYYTNSDGDWEKRENDTNGNCTYYEDCNGYWEKFEYDNNGNRTYFENSKGFWQKTEYDEKGNPTYFEDSYGYKEGTPRAVEQQSSTITK